MSFHRHHEHVDHSFADHNHGVCTEHAHWAGGTHPEGTPLEVSTPENDPLGHQVEDPSATRDYWCGYFRQTLRHIAAGFKDPKEQAQAALDAYERDPDARQWRADG